MPDRHVDLEGTRNFRDLGGYATADGNTVRWGRVYRSDNLGELTPQGWAGVAALGLRSVYDLRHEGERRRAPTHLPADLKVTSTHLPIGGEAAEAVDLVELLSVDGGTRFGIDFMVDMYRTMLHEHAGVFGTLLLGLADETRLPAVFHCTAGKDRTGVAAALLLSLLGVDRRTVLDDYELTTVLRSQHRIEELRPRLEAAGIDVETVRPFLSAPRPALEIPLAEIDRDGGGLETYLRTEAGVGPDTITALRASLLS